MTYNSLARWLMLFALMPGVPCHAAQESTFSQGSSGPFYGRAVVWDAAMLTEQNLRSYYQPLSKELNAYRAWTVYVFVDKGDASRELHGKLRTEETYDWWLELYNKFGHSLLPMAEFLSFEGNTVLRMRDSAGRCSESVLSGNNFLRLEVDGTKFEILEMYFSALPPHTAASPGDEAMIWLYVRSSVFPSQKQGRDFSLVMRERFRQRRIVIAIRTDSYFLTDGRFPIMYRFDQNSAPPSREEYAQSKTMGCFCDRAEVMCRP